MDYQLSEDELNSIYACMHQMDLMASLCAYVPAGHHAVPTAALESFLCTQHRALQAAISAVEGRKKAAYVAKQEATAVIVKKPTTMTISVDLMVRVMEVCSGAMQGDEAILKIQDELCDATFVHGHGAPLRAYYAALHRQGLDINVIVGNGVCQTTLTRAAKKKAPQSAKPPKLAARKREKLVAA